MFLKLKKFKLSDELAKGFAYTIARLVLGISFLNAAIWKIWVLTPIGHAEKFFITNFQNTWIPHFILWTLGLSIPFFELLFAILFCIGFKAREVAFLSGLLLIVTTYGHSLIDPLYNISQGLTFSRLALVIFLLIASNRHDIFSLDYFFSPKKN